MGNPPPPAESPAVDGLRPITSEGSLSQYVRDIRSRRSYLWNVPRQEIAAQHANTALGGIWNLLNPVLLVLFYYLIFGLILDVNRGSDNYITFLTIGVFVYQFSSRCILSGATSIISNIGLIRSLRFPRAILPMSVVIKQSLMHLNAVLLMVVVALLTGESPSLLWLALPAAIALQIVMNMGMAFVTARSTHSLPDLVNILPFVLRLGFYGSGVLFSVELRSQGRWPWLFRINPFYEIIEIHRTILMGGELHPSIVPLAIGWSVLFLVGGLVYFRRDEAFYGARY